MRFQPALEALPLGPLAKCAGEPPYPSESRVLRFFLLKWGRSWEVWGEKRKHHLSLPVSGGLRLLLSMFGPRI